MMMVMVVVRLPLLFSAFTVYVTEEVPLGVPEITPVPAFIVMVPGKAGVMLTVGAGFPAKTLGVMAVIATPVVKV